MKQIFDVSIKTFSGKWEGETLPKWFFTFTQLEKYQNEYYLQTQFARIYTSSLINIEMMLNRSFTKFYNGDDVNEIAAELWLIKTRPNSFYKKQRNIIFYKDSNKSLKTKC